jgi:hypothetical protein
MLLVNFGEIFRVTTHFVHKQKNKKVLPTQTNMQKRELRVREVNCFMLLRPGTAAETTLYQDGRHSFR